MPAARATGGAGPLVTPGRPRAARGPVAGAGRVCDAGLRSFTMANMDASALEVLTALLSLVSAVGVLVVNGKVDRLTGRVDNLTGRVDRLTGRVDALAGTLHTVVGALMGRNPLPGGSS